jgi:hypothetical protein
MPFKLFEDLIHGMQIDAAVLLVLLVVEFHDVASFG